MRKHLQINQFTWIVYTLVVDDCYDPQISIACAQNDNRRPKPRNKNNDGDKKKKSAGADIAKRQLPELLGGHLSGALVCLVFRNTIFRIIGI